MELKKNPERQIRQKKLNAYMKCQTKMHEQLRLHKKWVTALIANIRSSILKETSNTSKVMIQHY